MGPPSQVAVTGDAGQSENVRSANSFVLDANGALFRPLFKSTGATNLTVTIRDVVVAPQTTQAVRTLSGPVLIEWLEGHGTFSIGDGAPQTIDDQVRSIAAGQLLILL